MIEMEALGRQLRCPNGAEAKGVAEQMYRSNKGMIQNTLDSLKLHAGQHVLELGIGNGRHISALLKQAPDLHYTGVDISDAMLAEAASYNKAQAVHFIKVSGTGKLPLKDQQFNCFFSVNTLYFWENIAFQNQEIYRVLSPSALMALTYIDKDFGEQLPFTQNGFQFRTSGEVEQMLWSAGFREVRTTKYTEHVLSSGKQELKRPYYITLAHKP